MEITTLVTRLQSYFPWHRARLVCLAATVLALIKLRTVKLCDLAFVLNSKVLPASNERRLRRFFACYKIDYDQVARFILALLPQKKDFLISLDCTKWFFGKRCINVLVAAVVYKGIAVPLVWMLIAGRAQSKTSERIALLDRLLRVVPPKKMQALVADREFVGKSWFDYLVARNVPFVIRIMRNVQVGDKTWSPAAWQCFHSLKVGQERRLRKPRQVYGSRLYIVGKRLAQPGAKDEFIIVASSIRPSRALTTYRERWQIENLFGALKSRGFDFEATHLADKERVARLVAVLAIAFVWAHLLGVWLDEHVQAIKIKNHQRRAQSSFRYGLDYIREYLLNPNSERIKPRWDTSLNVLSGT